MASSYNELSPVRREGGAIELAKTKAPAQYESPMSKETTPESFANANEREMGRRHQLDEALNGVAGA